MVLISLFTILYKVFSIQINTVRYLYHDIKYLGGGHLFQDPLSLSILVLCGQKDDDPSGKIKFISVHSSQIK